MGSSTEQYFEGHSSDDTAAEIQTQIQSHPHVNSQFARQPGVGKGDAVRLGFSKARGDVLMILVLTSPFPRKTCPVFTRRSSPARENLSMESPGLSHGKRAMRFKTSSEIKPSASSFPNSGQPVKDTLCGTKVLWKRDYQTIAANRAYLVILILR